jgi:4-amino-4-deoxy-L-arabinose transferase-like glycosyltransferase
VAKATTARSSEENPAEGADAGAAPDAAAPSAAPTVSEAPSRWLDALLGWLDTDRKAELAVVVVGMLLFLPFLGTLGLWDPWETHYGEVARAMVARDDYVYPYWESAYFFSKPALTLWLIALGIFATGAELGVPPGDPLGTWVEWGIRLPFAALAIFAMWAVYQMGRRIQDRATGLAAAFVLGCSPQFIFIGKQAMTDGPLVFLMTAGFAFFVMAVFDREDDGPASKPLRIGTSIGIAAALFPQLFLIGREVGGPQLIGMLVAAALGLGFIGAVMTVASRRDCHLASFYTLIGLAALAKGLAVLAVVGPVVLLYCLVAWDWRLLLRSKFWIGGVLFLLVASPWYVVLTLFKGRDDEGLTFTQRFWYHDNFNRVGSGVHGDRAGLGYFVEQLAYGMFPWSAVLPFSVGHAVREAQSDQDGDLVRRRATLFVLVWALWCYVFFTISQTKFHHYIFPAVPAFAILIGLWFRWVSERPGERLRYAAGVVVLCLFAVGIRDIVNEPRNLVNLFTYKYDRDFPREIELWKYVVPITVTGGLAAVVLYALKRRGEALLAWAAMAALFAAWVSHHHFNMLSQHWSQAHLFKTYFDEKKGDEPIYAYQLNWRGETFYSRNRVLQVKERGANQRIKELVDQPGREFIVTEQSRFHTLKGALSADKRDKLQIIDRSNNKFYLCVVEE